MKLHIPISSWVKFEKQIRKRDDQLLEKLNDFPNAILVAGCQRSGTTAITNILREAIGMPPFSVTRDDELDGALILCGHASSSFQGRCCFQTTYLNERVTEYSKHDDFKLTWVIRNPHAVVSSMLWAKPLELY